MTTETAQEAQRVALALDAQPMFEVYGCLIDLAYQVHCDLTEGAPA